VIFHFLHLIFFLHQLHHQLRHQLHQQTPASGQPALADGDAADDLATELDLILSVSDDGADEARHDLDDCAAQPALACEARPLLAAALPSASLTRHFVQNEGQNATQHAVSGQANRTENKTQNRAASVMAAASAGRLNGAGDLSAERSTIATDAASAAAGLPHAARAQQPSADKSPLRALSSVSSALQTALSHTSSHAVSHVPVQAEGAQASTPAPLSGVASLPAATAALTSATADLVATTVSTTAQLGTPLTEQTAQSGWGQALMHQVVQQLASGKEVQQAQLQLNPPDLGVLHVSLRVEDSVAQAWFASPHAQVRDAVQHALPALAQHLQQAGLALGDTGVGSEQRPFSQALAQDFGQEFSADHASSHASSHASGNGFAHGQDAQNRQGEAGRSGEQNIGLPAHPARAVLMPLPERTARVSVSSPGLQAVRINTWA